MAEKIKYFCKRMNNDFHFDQGLQPDGKTAKPPKVISFKNHHCTTTDPEEQKLLEQHKDFGKKFYRVGPGHKLEGGTKYVAGSQSTGNSKPIEKPRPEPPEADGDGEVEMTGKQIAALARAEKKIEAGKPLTAPEQEVWDEFGDEE